MLDQQIAKKILEIFPNFVHMPTFDEEDLESPHLFLAQFFPYLRDMITLGKIKFDGREMELFFSLITGLWTNGILENKDLVYTGFFESMTSGQYGDQYFKKAAKKFLNPELYHIFRFIESGCAGNLEDFVDTEVE